MTPYIYRIGIGDCKHSAQIYMAGATSIIHGGQNLMAKNASIVKDNQSFIFEVQNKNNGTCLIRILYERYPDGKLEAIVPINCHKVGVSLETKDEKYPIGLELIKCTVSE